MNGRKHSRIAIRVSVSDSRYPGAVETRISIDDRPVVADAFPDGPAEPPEYLLGPDHRLHAGGGEAAHELGFEWPPGATD